MRVVWSVAGSLGLLLIAYAADRLLAESVMNYRIYGSASGWQELALATSLLGRAVILAGLVAVFMAVRRGDAKPASWAVAAIGAVSGLLPPLLLGLHYAVQPNGLAFVFVDGATAPVWDGTGVFLLWTGIGLLVVGIAGFLAGSATARGAFVSSTALPIGAALLFLLAYPVDALFEAVTIELASGIDGYPLFMLVSLTMRIAMMVGLVVLLTSVLERTPGRAVSAALLAVGIVGFVVLPLIGLLAPPVMPATDEAFATSVAPGTVGRWMAGAVLVVGAIALARSRAQPSTAKRYHAIAPGC